MDYPSLWTYCVNTATFNSEAVVFSGEHSVFYFKIYTEQEFTKNNLQVRAPNICFVTRKFLFDTWLSYTW